MVQVDFNLFFPNLLNRTEVNSHADLVRQAADAKHDFVRMAVQVFAFSFVGVQMVGGVKGKFLADEHPTAVIS
ncbi:hypothetical protein D3C76_1693260 [compost metagenome]